MIKKPSINIKPINKAKWNVFKNLKTKVYAQIEKLRQDKIINKSNEVDVTISFKNEFKFTSLQLEQWLNVAKVTIIEINNQQINVKISKTTHVCCPRCWNYFNPSELNKDNLCKRCQNVLKNA
jgi:isoleucyl-tRNA synthetase